VLVILDEACGVPEALWTGAEVITTTPGCRILAIGNPDVPGTPFERTFSSPAWKAIKVSAFDTPNFTGEDVPDNIASQLISVEWQQEKLADWGADNPLYQAKILAEFPKDAKDAVVRGSDAQRCRIPGDLVYGPGQLLPVELGVDVGGGGDDTVIRERRGPVAGREWVLSTDRPELIAPAVIEAIEKTGATRCKVDAIGVGAGLVGELRNRADTRGCAIIGVKASNSPSRSEFANTRAEYWWMARTLSETGAWDLSEMENADNTVAQLCNPRYSLNLAGKILIEKKEDIKERLGRSPDNAEALILAYFTPGSSLDEWFAVRNGKQIHQAYGQSPVEVTQTLAPHGV
jgi:hypothetical protein